MSKYDRIDRRGQWSKKECIRAIHSLENRLKNARIRKRSTNVWVKKYNPRFSDSYIAYEIEDTEEVLRMWQERLAEYE